MFGQGVTYVIVLSISWLAEFFQIFLISVYVNLFTFTDSHHKNTEKIYDKIYHTFR